MFVELCQFETGVRIVVGYGGLEAVDPAKHEIAILASRYAAIFNPAQAARYRYEKVASDIALNE
jgi:hypothetical protein